MYWLAICLGIACHYVMWQALLTEVQVSLPKSPSRLLDGPAASRRFTRKTNQDTQLNKENSYSLGALHAYRHAKG